MKDTPNIPKRRTTRKTTTKVDFLDSELRSATHAALRAKLDELHIVTDVVKSINAARNFYGYPPEWLAKIDRYEIAQALRVLAEETTGESELLKMIVGLKGGKK